MNTLQRPKAAFTLAEVLVSSALIIVIMGLLFSTVSQTQKLWQSTTTKVSQFQGARVAFDSMTRRLSQASLNTYWRAYDSNSDAEKEDLSFARKAELQFISGPTASIFSSPAIQKAEGSLSSIYPTHSMFFHAPLGYTEQMTTTGTKQLVFRNLEQMIMATGYFIEFGDEDKPKFIRDEKFPQKYRFRLKELNVPSEYVMNYRQPTPSQMTAAFPAMTSAQFNEQFITTDGDSSWQTEYSGLTDINRRLVPVPGTFKRPLWMQTALYRETVDTVTRFRFARTLADNIVALIILPKSVDRDPATNQPYALDALSPDYAYDSWRFLKPKSGVPATTTRYFARRDNVLPPIVQVTMVAIDEPSAARMNYTPSNLPDWDASLFKQPKPDGKQYIDDLEKLQDRIRSGPGRPTYRVFTTDVVVRGSKWSRFE